MKKFLPLLLLFFSAEAFAQVLPPPGCDPMYAVDDDNDGYTQFDIDVIYQHIRAKALSMGFDLSGYELQLYPSETDYDNHINPMGSLYTNAVPNFQFCYLDFTYTGSGQQYNPGDLDYNFHCWPLATVNADGDDDADGILNAYEDLNGNGMLIDENTDQDGHFNFLDADDDGDGIPTAQEDYNGDGNPANDDTNADGIPDYLEADVALSAAQNHLLSFTIVPNPAHDSLSVHFPDEIPSGATAVLFDGNGKSVQHIADLSKPVSVHGLAPGIYLLKITADGKESVSKVLVK